MAFKMNPGRGNYSKTGRSIPTPFKQVDKEVEAMIAKKKASESKAKTEKARSEGEAMRTKLEKAAKDKIMAETRKRASADSTAVDKKMRLAGFTGNTPGEMGNKKAEETRKAGSAYKNIYESVKKDKSTGKYKMGIGSKNEAPAKQLGRQAVTKMGSKKTPAKMKKC